MHGISFAAEAPPQTPLWGLISPHAPSVIRGREGEGKKVEKGGGEERGREEVPAVALKPQGPEGP